MVSIYRRLQNLKYLQNQLEWRTRRNHEINWSNVVHEKWQMVADQMIAVKQGCMLTSNTIANVHLKLHGHLIIVVTLYFPCIVALYLCTASESGEWHLGFRNASITSVNWLSDPTCPCSTHKKQDLMALGSNPRK